MINALTKKPYTRGNYDTLVLARRTSPEWATMKQWAQLGLRVKENEWRKYVRLKFFKSGVDEVTGEYETKLSYFNVFNREQLEE